jgi:hypothetical protein
LIVDLYICIFFSARHLDLTNKSDDTAQDLFLFVTSVLRLLQEDGWLSPLAQKGFFAMFGVPHDLGHIQTPSSRSNGMHMHKSCYFVI